MKMLLALLLLFSLASISAHAQAQANQPSTPGTEISAAYTYERANAPPSGCGCFSLNGGSLSVAHPFGSGKYAFAFDATFTHGNGSSQYYLNLATFTEGLRYRPLPRAAWNPFGQVLVGAAHADGGLVSGATPAATDPSLVFASTIGGGLDRKLNTRWSLRIIEADYVITMSSNRVNNHQNITRITTGIVYHFPR